MLLKKTQQKRKKKRTKQRQEYKQKGLEIRPKGKKKEVMNYIYSA